MRYLWSYTLKNPLWKMRMWYMFKIYSILPLYFSQYSSFPFYWLAYLWMEAIERPSPHEHAVRPLIKKYCKSQLIWIFRNLTTVQSLLWSLRGLANILWIFYVRHALVVEKIYDSKITIIWKFYHSSFLILEYIGTYSGKVYIYEGGSFLFFYPLPYISSFTLKSKIYRELK